MNWRVSSFLALFAMDSARREVVAVREMAETTAQPFILHVAEHSGSAIALCEGRLADAEAMAERSHEWSRLLTGRDASGVYGIQMFGVRREQGRLAELAPVVRMLASRGGAWRPGLASLLTELGMEADARRELARVASEGLDEFRVSLWLAALTYLTDAAAALGDEATAALLYPELEPHAGTNTLIGHMVACYGAADRHLGMLAATLGEWERAESHFERAMELNRALGARTWIAHTAYEHGRMLLRRGRDGRDRAGELLGEADGAGRADRHAGPARPHPLARRAAPGGRPAGRAVVPRGPDPRPRRQGPEQPRDRQRAVHQRAHGRQPHPQHPAQDELREPHRGGVVRPPARVGRVVGLRYGRAMPLFVIEREFAEELDLSSEDVRLIDEINADEGVRWVFSFLSADKRHTYCLYEAPSPDAILAAAKRANVPADAIVEVGAGLAGPRAAHARVGRGAGGGLSRRPRRRSALPPSTRARPRRRAAAA